MPVTPLEAVTENHDIKPPSDVTAEVFAQWRSPIRGSTNPQELDNPLWQWLIATRLNAYIANQALNGPSSMRAGPMWCFDRFGQSATTLPDDRTVFIAGEHEDHYDPDFYIYNDVVVAHEDGATEIYGYPVADFPPTDFHSASLTDRGIVLIGSLGYPQDRRVGETQVLVVEPQSWSVSAVRTGGQPPGWIHRHDAVVQPDGSSIFVTRGLLYRGEGLNLVENIDDWLLHLDGWRWERITDRRWQRFEIYRQDRKLNHLWRLRSTWWSERFDKVHAEAEKLKLAAELGAPPRLDLLAHLYRPPIQHEVLPEREDEHDVHRIRIDGVIVRFVNDSYAVQLTIEGDLPADVVETLRRHLVTTLETLEQFRVECAEIT